MEITVNKKKDKTYESVDFSMIFIHVTPQEALRLAESLIKQTRSGNPNDGRSELYDEARHYFSIAVSLPDERIK